MIRYLFAFLFLSVTVSADSLVVSGSDVEASYLNGLASTTNYGNDTIVRDTQAISNVMGHVIRMVDTWNSSLPAGYVIDSGALYSTVFIAPSGGTTTISTYKILSTRQWEETITTWVVVHDNEGGLNWTTAGCGSTTSDRAGAAESSVSVATTDIGNEKRWSITQATVSEWVGTSNGLFVRTATPNRGCTWKSDDAVSGQPRFVVYYHISSSSIRSLLNIGQNGMIQSGGKNAKLKPDYGY